MKTLKTLIHQPSDKHFTDSMSTASKITFGLSCAFAASAFVGINYLQRTERDALRQGPIKDAARLQQREFNQKQRANESEHKEQLQLKEKYEKLQPLKSEIITGLETE